jgi:hypothetical protein
MEPPWLRHTSGSDRGLDHAHREPKPNLVDERKIVSEVQAVAGTAVIDLRATAIKVCNGRSARIDIWLSVSRGM